MSGRRGKHGNRDRIVDLIAAGKTDEEIAAEVGCQIEWVRRVRRVPSSGGEIITRHNYDTERDRIEQGVAREWTDERIASEVGCTVERVARVRREMNAAVVSRENKPRKVRP